MTLPSAIQPYDWTFRRVVWATLVFTSVLIGFGLFYRFYQVIFILFIAIMMGTVIRPPVSWLYERGLPRAAGILLVYLLLFLLMIGFLLLLFPMILEQGATITVAVPDYYQSLREWLAKSNDLFLNQLLARFLPVTLAGLKPIQQTGPQMIASAEQALGYLSSAVRTVFIIIVTLVLSFYWTLDGPRVIKSFLLLVPQSRRESTAELIMEMESRLGFYIAGQATLCLVIGILALVAYLMIGLPNALVLALIAAVLEAVPMIGPILGAFPAALAALAISPDKLIWVFFSTIVIQQLENSLLVPRVMRRAVGVNPFVTLVAIFAFSSLFGLAGAFMAIPMAAIIQLALNHFVFHPAVAEPDNSPGRDFASRLRYEAQDLVQDLRKQARVAKGGPELRIKQIDRVMDEIESIVTDLDVLLNENNPLEES